ncbi:MAG: hypothetical protein ABFS30_07155, partial [Pseudomonadota bacterium]
MKSRLCGGVAAAVFMLALLAPVSIDLATGEITASAAQAGNGDGNYGNGKGNGGPNGEKPGGGKGDDGDDGAGDGTGDGALPNAPATEEGGGRDPGADAAADLAEVDFAETIDAVAGAPAEGPMAGIPATSLPTISQVFSMGDEA